MFSLPAIFDCPNIKSSLITNKCNFITSTVVSDLTAPIHFNEFNFNNFVSALYAD